MRVRYYSPVGRGVALLKTQGSISYTQSDKETYDMDDWIEKLANQYGRDDAEPRSHSNASDEARAADKRY